MSAIVGVAVQRPSSNHGSPWLWVPAFAGTTRDSSIRISNNPTSLRGAKRRSNPCRSKGRVDCFASLAMTLEYDSAFSRRDASEVCREIPCPRNQRAQGMPGAQCARSLAGQKKQAMPVVTVTTVTPEITRHSPHNGFTVSFVLSPVTGLSCHRHLRKLSSARLDTSVGVSGPHDFAVRLKRRSSIAPSASTASRPASVTIASRPSVGRDRDRYTTDLFILKNRIFLRRGA